MLDTVTYGAITIPNVSNIIEPRSLGLGTIEREGRIGGYSGRGRPRAHRITLQGWYIIPNPEANAGGDAIDNYWSTFVSQLYQLSKNGDNLLNLQTDWAYPARLESINPQERTWSSVLYEATFVVDKARRFKTAFESTLIVPNNTTFSIASDTDTVVYWDIGTTNGTTYTLKTDRNDGTITIVATATSTITLDMENHRAWRGTVDARSEIRGNFPEIPANTNLTLICTGTGLTTVNMRWKKAGL